MRPCVSCGYMTPSENGICPHHHTVWGDNWSAANRIWCDYFHRGVEIHRLAETDRNEDFWGEPSFADVA